MKGLFISVEGADGTGKSTQIKRVAEALKERGAEVVLTREPGGTEVAEMLRTIVLNPDIEINVRTETLLYIAARADHIEKVIKPALAAGKIILCDRFSDSTLVYQGIVKGLPLNELEQLTSFAVDGVMPDITILLDADPKDLLGRREERGVSDRYENEGLIFQQGIANGFRKLAQNSERIKIINALQDIDCVTADILKEIDKALK